MQMKDFSQVNSSIESFETSSFQTELTRATNSSRQILSLAKAMIQDYSRRYALLQALGSQGTSDESGSRSTPVDDTMVDRASSINNVISSTKQAVSEQLSLYNNAKAGMSRSVLVKGGLTEKFGFRRWNSNNLFTCQWDGSDNPVVPIAHSIQSLLPAISSFTMTGFEKLGQRSDRTEWKTASEDIEAYTNRFDTYQTLVSPAGYTVRFECACFQVQDSNLIDSGTVLWIKTRVIKSNTTIYQVDDICAYDGVSARPYNDVAEAIRSIVGSDALTGQRAGSAPDTPNIQEHLVLTEASTLTGSIESDVTDLIGTDPQALVAAILDL